MPTLYTSGYEQHATPDSLIAALTAAGVERVIDVRHLPLSRRRGFSKTKLGEALAAAGIVYEHQRALGNPKHLRELYRSGRADEGRRLFEQHLHGASAPELAQLEQSLMQQRVCLLCLEQDATRCHRDVIIESLQARIPGLAVEHL